MSNFTFKIPVLIIFLSVCLYSQEMENLGGNVNSEVSEINPMITVDGRTLYFTRSTNTDGKEYQYLWKSEADENGNWQMAVKLEYPFNKGDVNNIISISPDGNTIIFTRGNYSNEKMETLITTKEGDSWAPAEFFRYNFENKMQFKYVRYSHYCYSGTGQVLLVSANNSVNDDDTYGEIYVLFKNGDSWSKAKKLGPPINVNEGKWGQHNPFLASDDATLYFSSERKSGLGGLDIYMSKRLDDSWENWSEPVNMGAIINTDKSESYYSIAAKGDYAYLVSSKESPGNDDIYRLRLSENFKPGAVVLISGRVYNAVNNLPIGVDINYFSLPEGKTIGTARSNSSTGFYRIILPYGRQYSFLADKEGFYSISNYLDLSVVNEYKEMTVDIEMRPIEVGESFRLNNIFFDFAKSTLKPESYQEMDRVVKLLNESPNMEIELSGHTDNVGSDEFNMNLSQARAGAVTNYIISKGINAGRITAKGYGESMPVATNETDEGRQLNRRVEFKILKK
jgi:OmpA-OmpF porin, OOP family